MSSQTNRRRKRDPYEGLSEITRRLGWQARSERNLPSGVVPAPPLSPCQTEKEWC